MLDSPSFYADAADVPAQLGIRFGFQYRLIGSPSGRDVPLRAVWQIPAPGITNPVNGNTYRESARDFRADLRRIRAIIDDTPEGAAGSSEWLRSVSSEITVLAARVPSPWNATRQPPPARVRPAPPPLPGLPPTSDPSRQSQRSRSSSAAPWSPTGRARSRLSR